MLDQVGQTNVNTKESLASEAFREELKRLSADSTDTLMEPYLTSVLHF
jgi:hypothetical protein